MIEALPPEKNTLVEFVDETFGNNIPKNLFPALKKVPLIVGVTDLILLPGSRYDHEGRSTDPGASRWNRGSRSRWCYSRCGFDRNCDDQHDDQHDARRFNDLLGL